MNPVLATLDAETARRVAEDVRDHGHGYIRIDHEGRASHVPAYAVMHVEQDRRTERRMHE